MRRTLIAMGGLPGVGKSTIAEGVARALGITLLSVDPVEAALRRVGLAAGVTGLAAYVVVEVLAQEQLRLGHSVIIDAVNPVEAARVAWRAIAARTGSALRIVECVCDEGVHRRRVEARVRNIPGLPELTWDQVERRKAAYQPWSDDRLILDTARLSAEALIASAVSYVA